MPNTLVHWGVQTLATRRLWPDAELRWITLGFVVPDLPWIGQRVARELLPFDLYEVRLYAIAQASLLVSLFLCAALASLSSRPARVFPVLAANAAVHLLLDALQTKWANGVHLLAPFSWELWNVGLFWPESPVTIVLSAVGLGVATLLLWREPPRPRPFVVPSGPRALAAALFLAAWAASPLLLRGAPEAAGNHFVSTLRSEQRAGRPIEFDRVRLEPGVEGPRIVTWAGESLAVAGSVPHAPALISVRGVFLDQDLVELRDVHVHAGAARDAASYLGLAAAALAWWPRRRTVISGGEPAEE